ncbi:MAG: hypothetical protein CME06_15745 [Gemmatimonadetes bacterium]|nr:hypothetical protein [Gemmatimonadota bacterium]
MSSNGPVRVTNNTFVGNQAFDVRNTRPGDGAAIFIGVAGFCGNNVISQNSGGTAVAIASRATQWGFQLFDDNADGEYSRYGFLQPSDALGASEFVAPEEKDFRIASGSDAIDAGHVDLLDADGTRSDIGAYAVDQRFPVHAYISRAESLVALGQVEEWAFALDNIHTEAVGVTMTIEFRKDGHQLRTFSRSLRLEPERVWRRSVPLVIPPKVGEGAVSIRVLLNSGWQDEWRGRLVSSPTPRAEASRHPSSPIRCGTPADGARSNPM